MTAKYALTSFISVSYTHLDVYKRQKLFLSEWLRKQRNNKEAIAISPCPQFW